jgi:hypothetical protein
VEDLIPGIPDMAGLLPRGLGEEDRPTTANDESRTWPMKFRQTPPLRSRRFLGSSGRIPGAVPREGLGGGLKDASVVWRTQNMNKYDKAKVEAYINKDRTLRESQLALKMQWRAIKEDPMISVRLSEFTKDVPVPSKREERKRELRVPLYPGAPSSRPQSPSTTLLQTPETTVEFPEAVQSPMPTVGEGHEFS